MLFILLSFNDTNFAKICIWISEAQLFYCLMNVTKILSMFKIFAFTVKTAHQSNF